MSRKFFSTLSIILGFGLPCAFAAEVYNEGTSGDASSSETAPTAITLAAGSNTITGSVTTSTGDTRDFYTFQVPAGFELTALRVVGYDDPAQGPANDGNRGFHALDAGGTTVIPAGGTSGNLLGGGHLDASDVGNDVLPEFAGGSAGSAEAGSGFTAPLPEGTYCYIIQQTGSHVSDYEIEFELTAATPPAGFQPDAKVGKSLASLKGNDIYNPSASGQKLVLRSTNNKTLRSSFSIENDGTEADIVRVAATRGNRFFKVNYYQSEVGNVTGAILAGTINLDLAVGESQSFRKVIKPRLKRTERRKKKRKFNVTAISQSDTDKLDRIRTEAQARRRKI